RMFDQRLTDLIARATQQRKYALVQTTVDDCMLNDTTHQLGRTGMTVMRFDDDRATRSQGRGGVSASDRIGDRKVAGAEDDDRPDRHLLHPVVEARARLTVRLGRIDGRLKEAPLADDRGKLPELSRRLTGLA